MVKKVTANNDNPITSTKKELATFTSTLPDNLQSSYTHDSFKVLNLFADLYRRQCVKEQLSKDTIPHSLRFKFKLTSYKSAKDLPKSKALSESSKKRARYITEQSQDNHSR